YTVYRLLQAQGHPTRRPLLIVASSYLAYTFFIRPFTNSLETVLLCLILQCLSALFLTTHNRARAQARSTQQYPPWLM
ncbi:hypothetical protein H4R34_006269, partial [Dimargaris verticillata]